MDAPRNSLVRDIMQAPVKTVAPTLELGAAVQTMHAAGLTCVVIDLEDPSRGFGILTQKDVIGFLFDGDIDLEGTLVEDVMSHPCVTLCSEFSLETAIGLMRMMGVRRAPVVDAGSLVGILSFTDVFNFAMTQGSSE